MYMVSGTPAATMRTRRESYPSPSDGITYTIRPQQKKRRLEGGEFGGRPWKLTFPSTKRLSCSGFDNLPEDLLIIILSSLSSTASSPADLVNAMLVNRRFCATATHPRVLENASPAALAVTAASWSDGAHRFLRQCADARNIEACYTLGMIRFYCLGNRAGGASLMAKAAMQSHAAALHSLAVIQFNGSGGTRKDKDLKAGVALCVRAATLGHVDAMRELGHCLQDGYGVGKNVYEGRRLLLEANAREAAAAAASAANKMCSEMGASFGTTAAMIYRQEMHRSTAPVSNSSTVTLPKTVGDETGLFTVESVPVNGQMYKIVPSCSLLSDFGCTVPPSKLHIANKFLVDWFGCHPPVSGLRLCSHGNCGRPETRLHEFRRCSACGCVNYCSRACQALDWKIRHKFDCQPVHDWEDRQDNDGEEDDQMAFEDDHES
ncbi:unnamed protein product [Calypogeia fissa]